MDEQRFEGNYGRVVLLDLCHGCHGLWFDTNENLTLTPGAILRLFSLITEKQDAARQPLAEVMRCPRCGRRLVATTDQQRDTRFHYFRCPQEHGRFITFFQFLREKNFIRSLNAKEIDLLKQHIQTVNCSNCGAVINVTNDMACSYCRSPVSLLDPEQLKTTMQVLKQTEAKQQHLNSALPLEFILERIKADAKYHQRDDASDALPSFLDLLDVGVATVVDLLTDSPG
jgi:hypothetical protein